MDAIRHFSTRAAESRRPGAPRSNAGFLAANSACWPAGFDRELPDALPVTSEFQDWSNMTVHAPPSLSLIWIDCSSPLGLSGRTCRHPRLSRLSTVAGETDRALRNAYQEALIGVGNIQGN
jgi:hypothetical protein